MISVSRPPHLIILFEPDKLTLNSLVCSGDDGDCTYQIRPHKEFWLVPSLSRLSLIQILHPNLNACSNLSAASEAEDSGVSVTNASARDEKPDIFGGSAYGGSSGQDVNIDELVEMEEHRRKMELVRLGCFTNTNADLAVSGGGRVNCETGWGWRGRPERF